MQTNPKIAFAALLLLAVSLVLSVPMGAEEPLRETGEDLTCRMIFLGESTTAHLRSRGVLPGGTETVQVWANRSGTMMLDSRAATATILYPETGEELTILEATARKKPEFLVLSFGLNGIIGFRTDPALYVRCYQKLISALHEASPETAVILQTVYPVAKEQADWKFSLPPAEINRAIRELNERLPEIAGAFPFAAVADTASVLPDAEGFLRAEYSEDGIHLTQDAYRAVLAYLASAVPERLKGR